MNEQARLRWTAGLLIDEIQWSEQKGTEGSSEHGGQQGPELKKVLFDG